MTQSMSFNTSGLERRQSGVWAPADIRKFGYSDGVATESYLARVFAESTDLSCASRELRHAIKDWPSEYHLSFRRAQLLSGLDFGQSPSVLEVGCGCGAITRFLGETFDDVTSIEGSLVRAELARKRCEDLDHVQIVCSPFQEVEFTKKFDIVFCIGVLEYSGSFVDSDVPYSDVIDIFADVLNPDGTVIVAIENQFGLKYLNGCREDHVGRKYEGIEGYPHSSDKVRTFGKRELHGLLGRRFPVLDFYYPFPDYKVPDSVLDDSFVGSADAGEFISQNVSRDYVGPREKVWNEPLVAIEMARNQMLGYVADSFLIVASKSNKRRVTFPQAGIVFSSQRRPQFNTVSRCLRNDDRLRVSKRRQQPEQQESFESLAIRETDDNWVEGESLFTTLYRRSFSDQLNLASIFAPCREWADDIKLRAKDVDGVLVVPGSYVDATWRNSYLGNGECRFIDTEWEWQKEIPFKILVARSIYIFIEGCSDEVGLPSALRRRRGRHRL